MKIRTDFVTNSSSSSFVIARKPELTEKQKDIIVNYVKDKMLGRPMASTEEELKEYYKDMDGWSGEDTNDLSSYCRDKYEKSLQYINKGFQIWGGHVQFDDGEDLAYLLTELWEELEKHTADDFAGIDTCLGY